MNNWRRASYYLATAHRGITVQRRGFNNASHSQTRVHTLNTGNRVAVLISTVVGVACILKFGYPSHLYAEGVAPPAEIKFEEPRARPNSREENRDLISSQHLQVKRSWENPGVYAWGSNTSKVVAPDSNDTIVKLPRRIAYFDGKLIRDIKLDRKFGAAIDEKGDLLQWGTGFSPTCQGPTPTLRGKDLVKISISRDRIIALSASGTVYSIPASQQELETGTKPKEKSSFWSSSSQYSYRTLQPAMQWGEKVMDISSGLEHCLLLTSTGRLFSAASATEDFPSKGQLGIPGLTWNTRPKGWYDQPHEIGTLQGFEITKIATGDYHSLAVDKQGRVFAFGDNTFGQLGFDVSSDSSIVDAPSLLPFERLYRGTGLSPRVTGVSAGGLNSFFTVDATRVAKQDDTDAQGLGRITADTWSCGQGLYGVLGNNRWTHIQGTPTKIKALSGLFEYDETINKVVPIRLSYLSVGSTHASATLNNVTHVGASNRSSENDTNWGADVMWWGSNEFYQLGTGKRSNMNTPTYIAPLDIEADKEKGRREEHRFQITPRKKIQYGGRAVSVEQRIECGRGVTAVYSGT